MGRGAGLEQRRRRHDRQLVLCDNAAALGDSAPPALKAIVPTITGSAYYDGWTYQGGVFQLGFTLRSAAEMACVDMLNREARGEDVSTGRDALDSVVHDLWEAFWRLPLVELPHRSPWLRNYGDWLAHPDRDEFWRSTAIDEQYDRIDVPALHVAGWNDIFLKGSLENFVGLRDAAASEQARQGQRLIVTPWGHDRPPSRSRSTRRRARPPAPARAPR
jgi:uncharacterized protein